MLTQIQSRCCFVNLCQLGSFHPVSARQFSSCFRQFSSELLQSRCHHTCAHYRTLQYNRINWSIYLLNMRLIPALNLQTIRSAFLHQYVIEFVHFYFTKQYWLRNSCVFRGYHGVNEFFLFYFFSQQYTYLIYLPPFNGLLFVIHKKKCPYKSLSRRLFLGTHHNE